MQKIKEIILSKFKAIAPAFGFAMLIVLFSVIAANILYHQKPVLKRGFEIEVASDGKPVVKAEAKPVDLASMMKTADAVRGEKIFKKCSSCHSAQKGAGNKVGPNLFGVVGRSRASISGFSYSDAMKAKGGSWDKESINLFITKPKDFVPGTKMAFAGLKKPQDRADVILYLEKQR